MPLDRDAIRHTLLSCAVVLATMTGTTARAQPLSFSTQRLEPALSPLNYLVTESGEVLPHLSPSAALYLNYTHRPLILSLETGDQDLIRYQLNMDVMVALGLFRFLEVGVDLPVTMAQGSDGLQSLGYSAGDGAGAGIGDLRIVVKGRFWGTKGFALGASAPVTVPTGSGLLGGRTAFAPRLIASLDSTYVGGGVNVGYRVSKDQSFAGPNGVQQVVIDDEVFGSLGLRGTVWKGRLDLLLDCYLSFATRELDREELQAELAYGVRARFTSYLTGQLLATNGLTPGVGTPTFRILGGVAYQYTPASEPAKAEPPSDEDKDGDGIIDSKDKCPSEAEDKDGFEDGDGCPDPDNDKDGIPDGKDKCPNEAEDKDGFGDDDGCPDPDNDKDGVPDARDSCPKEAEDKDSYKDDDGCPDLDNDSDGIPDARDRCPNEPEVFNGVEDEDGCPDKSKGPVQVQQGKVTTPPVFFATNKDVILGRSLKMLAMVHEVLKANPWIKKVRIEGHTDSRGNAELNLSLSRRRAESVRKFLVDSGIEADRLEAEGFGKTRPVDDNKSAKGRAKNRRVDFVIVDPASAGN